MVMGALAFSGIVLIGFKIFLNAWVRKKDLPGSDQIASLAEVVESLRAETEGLRDQLSGEIAEVQERLDFAERMLTRGSRERSGETRKDRNTPT